MKEMQTRRQHPPRCTKKRALSSKHIQHGCVSCLVCVKGDQAQKHPRWVFSSSKKGATLVCFCALPVWVEDGGGCGGGQLIGSRCGSCHVVIRKLPYLDYFFVEITILSM